MTKTIECVIRDDFRCGSSGRLCMPVVAEAGSCPTLEYVQGGISREQRDKRVKNMALMKNVCDPRRAA